MRRMVASPGVTFTAGSLVFGRLVLTGVTTFEVRPADSRLITRTEWLESRHSFAFGAHYDPGNTHFGLLLAHNVDVVAPGTGYDSHPHRDTEIVTWMVQGSLVHTDSQGHTGLIYPGLAQRMSAGTGIVHSERNGAVLPAGTKRSEHAAQPGDPAEPTAVPARFVQMWLMPSEHAVEPSYEQFDIADALAGGGWVRVASGRSGDRAQCAVRLHQRAAALDAARLPAGTSLGLPPAPFVHLYVVDGRVDLEQAGPLEPGDAVRIHDSDGRRITARGPAEVLVWQMHADLTGSG
jgi:redox-sensitive bicupin YhaK (pirin superfamily)